MKKKKSILSARQPDKHAATGDGLALVRRTVPEFSNGSLRPQTSFKSGPQILTMEQISLDISSFFSTIWSRAHRRSSSPGVALPPPHLRATLGQTLKTRLLPIIVQMGARPSALTSPLVFIQKEINA